MTHTPQIQAHAHYLNISIPYLESGGFQDEVLAAIGMALPHPRPECPGLYDIGLVGRQIGTLKFVRRGEVFVVSLSGTALMFLRANDCFSDFLWCFAELPHRVTHLDAAYDCREVEASPIVLELYRRGIDRGFRLSQPKAPVSCHFALNDAGVETGTVYVGGKNARVSLAVCDKRQEQIVKGRPDPGPMIRYELRFRGREDAVPLTLRDAADPPPLFWHYMSEYILAPPKSVVIPAWVKTDAVGYDLAPRTPRTDGEQLRRWAERVGADGVAIADRLWRHGRSLLLHLMGLSVRHSG